MKWFFVCGLLSGGLVYGCLMPGWPGACWKQSLFVTAHCWMIGERLSVLLLFKVSEEGTKRT